MWPTPGIAAYRSSRPIINSPKNGRCRAGKARTFSPSPFIAVDQQGNVIASDPTGWRLFVWDREGNAKATIGQFGTTATDFGLPNGVTIAPDGALWVADADNHRLMRFDALQ